MDIAERTTILELAYELFNERRIDELLAMMVDDARWPDVVGGTVLVGGSAIRQYWESQFAVSDPRVVPLEFVEVDDVLVAVVEQRIADLRGDPVTEPVVVFHRYSFRDSLISRMTVHRSLEEAARAVPR